MINTPPSRTHNFTACPACYDEVAIQFNRTVELYNDLLQQIDSVLASLNRTGSGDGSGEPDDFISQELFDQLKSYQATLEELLLRALNATEG